MNTIAKANWTTDANHVRLSMPIAKVDRVNRLVSGFATLDNVDSQGDIVLSEASQKAFARARGNLREMHQPVAVGKIVDFREEEFFHGDKLYRGIFVTAYVSKGAESTWEKVLDETLTGFSIGGDILDSSTEFVKEQNASVRFIKDYELNELSLVDNPANHLANVFSIVKSADGQTMVEGMVATTNVENVFWCESDSIFKADANENVSCSVCGTPMKNVGWFESGTDRAEKVRDVVTKFLGPNAAENEGEGGVDMSKEVKKSTEEEAAEAQETETAEPVDGVEETATTVDAQTGEAVEGDVVEPVDETPDESEVIAKKIDELKDSFVETLEKARAENASAVSALEKKIDELDSSFKTKTTELETKFSQFGENLETAKAKLTELEGSLEKYNSSESFKKSGDVESPEPVQKSGVWNGAFSVDTMSR